MGIWTLATVFLFKKIILKEVDFFWYIPLPNISLDFLKIALLLIIFSSALFLISFVYYLRFKFLNYLLFSLFIFFFLLAFISSFNVPMAEDVNRRLLFAKLVTISFSTGIFFFTFFMLNSSIIRKRVEPYIAMGFLYGLELLDAFYFKISPNFFSGDGWLSSPVRSIYAYYFRSFQLSLGYTAFIVTCLLFLKSTRSRKRRWEMVSLSILLTIFVIGGTVLPIASYSHLPVVIQYVTLFLTIVSIMVLMVFDPFLLIVWSGRLKGFIVYHRENVLIFHNFVEEIYAELVSKYLNHVLKAAEDLTHR